MIGGGRKAQGETEQNEPTMAGEEQDPENGGCYSTSSIQGRGSPEVIGNITRLASLHSVLPMTGFNTIVFGFWDVWSFSSCGYHTEPWLPVGEMLSQSTADDNTCQC